MASTTTNALPQAQGGFSTASDAEARSVQGPGVANTLQDTNATTTLSASQTFDLGRWAGKYIQVEAEVADVFILFMPAGTIPSTSNFDPTTIAKDAASPSSKIPTRIYAGAPPRSMIVPENATMLAYRGVTATGNIRVIRG